MAQLVARLVRNEKVGGSNPPSSTTDRHPIRMSVFLYAWALLWRRWCSGRRRARPPARSPHASLRLGVVDLEARPCPPDPPAPSTLAALVSLGLVRPGPTTAHGHRSQAPPAPTALQPGPPGPPAPSTPAALVSLGLVRPGPAAAHGTAVWPSGPSGALHTGGACVAWTSPARPHHHPPAPRPGPASAHRFRR